jgi:hypothetical protein
VAGERSEDGDGAGAEFEDVVGPDGVVRRVRRAESALRFTDRGMMLANVVLAKLV